MTWFVWPDFQFNENLNILNHFYWSISNDFFNFSSALQMNEISFFCAEDSQQQQYWLLLLYYFCWKQRLEQQKSCLSYCYSKIIFVLPFVFKETLKCAFFECFNQQIANGFIFCSFFFLLQLNASSEAFLNTWQQILLSLPKFLNRPHSTIIFDFWLPVSKCFLYFCYYYRNPMRIVLIFVWLFVLDFISIRSHFWIDFEETKIALIGNNLNIWHLHPISNTCSNI